MVDLIFYGLPSDHDVVREAFDIAMGMPIAPTSGPHKPASPEAEEQLRTTWWALTKEQRDSTEFDHLWIGWSLRWSNVYAEPEPGNRVYSWVTDGIDALITTAQSLGRPLTLQHILALQAAKVASTVSLPINWEQEIVIEE
jgi:hypothetical protein